MDYTRLGQTELQVSRLCLGTMTWGEQNSEADAHAQLDAALDAGINFIDTAELYPVPPRAATQGRTEQYIGTWLAKRGRRDDLVLATKVVGPSSRSLHFRGGPRLNRVQITQALEESLRRLQTDYVDLYQVHWPERSTNYFGSLGFTVAKDPHPDVIPIEETLAALDSLVQSGKVRHIGISNETPWGVMRYLRAAEGEGLSRIVSIQNPYSLLNRACEVGLAEICYREQIGLLAYSPLAFGTLSGKYLKDPSPLGSRLSLFPEYTRYSTPAARDAIAEYVSLARRYQLLPTQMALAFLLRQPFLTSAIIGATTLDQLAENLGSVDVSLDGAICAQIEAIHHRFSNPCP